MTKIAVKQTRLTAGSNVTITGDTISATSGGDLHRYDLGGFFRGSPTASQSMIRQIIGREALVDSDNEGSAASETPTTASTTYTIKVDGTSVATVVFGVSATIGTIIWTGSETIAAGSVVEVVAPATPDPTHADISVEIRASTSGQRQAYDFGGAYNGLLPATDFLFSYLTPRPIEIDATDPARVKAGVAATASKVLDIQVNGTSRATATFAASGTVATISWTGSRLLAANDVIQIISPATPDTTLADVSFGFKSDQLVSNTAHDMNMFFGGVPTANLVLYEIVPAVPIVISRDYVGRGDSEVNPTALTTYVLQIDDEQRATIVFAASQAFGIITWNVDRDFVIPAGSVIKVLAPSSPDTTHAKFTIGFGAEELTDAEVALYQESDQKSARWRRIRPVDYADSPVSTSTITVSNTTGISAGHPIKFVQAGITYYALVSAVTTDTLITINGAPLIMGSSITDLRVGYPSGIFVIRYYLPGVYAVTAGLKLLSIANQYDVWMQGPAYLVAFSARHKTNDATVNPFINIEVGGSLVSTAATTNGIQVLSASLVDNPAVSIDITNYLTTFKETIDIRVTVAAGTGTAADLTVLCYYVLA